jgi:hypothetical protein
VTLQNLHFPVIAEGLKVLKVLKVLKEVKPWRQAPCLV